MPLDEYLALVNESQKAFAERLNPPLTQSAISQWIGGSTEIALSRAIEIRTITGGLVTIEDCAGMYRPKSRVAA